MKLEIPNIVKEDIEKRYIEVYHPLTKREPAKKLLLLVFWSLHFDKKVGVLIAYCDSKGIYIGREHIENNSYWLYTENTKYFDENEWNYLDIKNITQISALNQAFKLIEKTL